MEVLQIKGVAPKRTSIGSDLATKRVTRVHHQVIVKEQPRYATVASEQSMPEGIMSPKVVLPVEPRLAYANSQSIFNEPSYGTEQTSTVLMTAKQDNFEGGNAYYS